MAKFVADEVIDAALNHVTGKEPTPGLTLCVCAGAPANRAAALTSGANGLAQVDLAGADMTGPADDTSGRKIDFAEKASFAVTNSGNADHITIVDDTNILVQTTCALTAVSNTGTVTVQTWKWNIQDPT